MIEDPRIIQRFLGPTRLHFRVLFLQYSFTVASVTSLPRSPAVSRALYQRLGSISLPTQTFLPPYTPYCQWFSMLSYGFLYEPIGRQAQSKKSSTIVISCWLENLGFGNYQQDLEKSNSNLDGWARTAFSQAKPRCCLGRIKLGGHGSRAGQYTPPRRLPRADHCRTVF